jgi:hypothetical protein
MKRSSTDTRAPNAANPITRREAIERVGALLGGAALVGQSALLAACAADRSRRTDSAAAGRLFSKQDIALLDEVAETILPETSTPGAKAAGVGPFIALMVADTYDEREQQIFVAGLQSLEQASVEMLGSGFRSATAEQRLRLVEMLDWEQYDYMRSRRSGAPAHYFRMIKELALLGYFTSQIGCTQAMRYEETPRTYDPCVSYTPGEKAWAPHA